MRLDIDQGVVTAVSGRNLNALPALTTPPDRVAGVSGLETVNVPEAAGLHLPFAGRGPSSYKIAYIDLVTALISTLISTAPSRTRVSDLFAVIDAGGQDAVSLSGDPGDRTIDVETVARDVYPVGHSTVDVRLNVAGIRDGQRYPLAIRAAAVKCTDRPRRRVHLLVVVIASAAGIVSAVAVKCRRIDDGIVAAVHGDNGDAEVTAVIPPVGPLAVPALFGFDECEATAAEFRFA